MAKKKQDEPPKGAPAWTTTFSDLMNLLLCFFVLLFSMSTVDAEKFEQVAASLASSFSVLSGGGSAIGEGVLISSGVSQLSDLDVYFTSMGKNEEGDTTTDEKTKFEQEALDESEQMAEQIEEMIKNSGIEEEVEIDFNSHYVLLTLNGAFLFDSGSAQIKEDSLLLMDKIGLIIEKYPDRLVEIEGHTDNVPISNSHFRNNNELSTARALAVLEYYVAQGIDPVKLKSSGRGEYVPIADNSTAEGRARNRRVEVKIYNSYSDY
ncbi:OmpA/MotB family protein [Lachnotalea glycerini]|uniref:Chemotaxis protein n=1 Tax=Lachnotalea glycerini TaxID=1763509 RepID=A0A371JIB5_9FIRM|nr:flagellar motor protein MotB [Lachnotalea glycerini]RDY32475.1 chemotaxis protein [Lachnotalea glycerini]